MPVSPDVAHHRARVANAALRGDTSAAADARRDLHAAKLEDHITRTLATFPPLTATQREHLADLLRPAVSG